MLVAYLYRCVLEKCSRLCTECDKVFHKAASKRHHFRLSLKKLGKEEQNMFQTTKSSLFKCLSKSGREASQYLPVVHDLNAFKGSSSPARIPSSEEDYISSDILKQAFGDHVLILLSASLRGLLDDMKVRYYFLLINTSTNNFHILPIG